jgi:hypothetical protein
MDIDGIMNEFPTASSKGTGTAGIMTIIGKDKEPGVSRAITRSSEINDVNNTNKDRTLISSRGVSRRIGNINNSSHSNNGITRDRSPISRVLEFSNISLSSNNNSSSSKDRSHISPDPMYGRNSSKFSHSHGSHRYSPMFNNRCINLKFSSKCLMFNSSKCLSRFKDLSLSQEQFSNNGLKNRRFVSNLNSMSLPNNTRVVRKDLREIIEGKMVIIL